MTAIQVPNVSLRQLQYIVAIADLGGFRRAADACRVAQPSLSVQVARAEEVLGVQIFERDRRTVRVSRAGTVVVEQARRVLIAASDLGELARQRGDQFRGTLRLGVIPTVGPYLLPEITPVLTKSFPSLKLLWTEARTIDLIRRINESTLDGVLLALEADAADLDHAVLAWDPFVLAAAPAHPLMKQKGPATADALTDADVLLLDDGHCLRNQALALCQQSGAREGSFRATSLATLAQMVSAGDSVTLLPSLALPVENRRAQLRVRRFAPPEPGRTLVLAWRRQSSLRTVLAAVADVCRAALASHTSGAPVEERSRQPPVERR